jgi:hypothetical protein
MAKSSNLIFHHSGEILLVIHNNTSSIVLNSSGFSVIFGIFSFSKSFFEENSKLYCEFLDDKLFKIS